MLQDLRPKQVSIKQMPMGQIVIREGLAVARLGGGQLTELRTEEAVRCWQLGATRKME